MKPLLLRRFLISERAFLNHFGLMSIREQFDLLTPRKQKGGAYGTERNASALVPIPQNVSKNLFDMQQKVSKEVKTRLF